MRIRLQKCPHVNCHMLRNQAMKKMRTNIFLKIQQKRKAESLYCEDTVNFNQFVDGCNPNKFLEEVVVAINREKRQIWALKAKLITQTKINWHRCRYYK